MNYETEINFDKFHQVVQEYEKLIEELTSEINVYKSEHEANKTTVSILINENRELASRLKEALKIAEKEEIEHVYTENDLIENLKKQLATLAKEKESVVQLWQTSLKTIDYLEEELRLYEGRTHGYVPRSEIKKLKTSYEGQIEALHNKIEESNCKLQEIRKTCEQELNEKTKSIDNIVSQLIEAQGRIDKFEQELKEVQEKFKESEKARSALQASLVEKNKLLDGFIVREEVAKNKVREAVSVVETALMEKDAALLREAQAKEEVARVTKTLSEVIQENDLKVKAEINQIRVECSMKLNQLREELTKAKEEMLNKNFELEKAVLKNEALQKEIEILQKGTSQSVDSDLNKLLVLEKNLESTFQKLLLSERKNVQLSAERDGIKADLEQMAAHFERDIKTREIERQSLENKVVKLQEELRKSKSNLVEAVAKFEGLNKKYYELRKLYKSKKGSCKKTLADITVKHSKLYNEIRKCHEKQVVITEKWKSEAISVYKTLGKKVKELTMECRKLRTNNKKLKDALSTAENIIARYELSLQTFCADLENLNT